MATKQEEAFGLFRPLKVNDGASSKLINCGKSSIFSQRNTLTVEAKGSKGNFPREGRNCIFKELTKNKRQFYECWRRGSERKILRGWHKDAADCFRIYSEGLSGNLHLSLLRKLSYFPRPQFPSLFRQKHFPCQEAISSRLFFDNNWKFLCNKDILLYRNQKIERTKGAWWGKFL